MTTNTFQIAGMTCRHCVISVSEEVGEVAGVTGTDVDLASGRMTVTGEGYDTQAIHDAVAEAGYDIVAMARAFGGAS